MKLTQFTLIIAVACTLCSCATILSNQKACINIDGDVDGPVTITSNSDTAVNVALPYAIQVNKKHLEVPISVTSDSTLLATIHTGRKVNGLTWINIATGVWGFIVDGVSGRMYLPRQTEFTITGTPGQVFEAPAKTSVANYRHELALNIGFASAISANRYRDTRHAIEQMPMTEEDLDCFNLGTSSFSLRYYYHINPHLAVGMQVGTTARFTPYMIVDQVAKTITDADLWARSFYTMASAKYYWNNTNASSVVFYNRVSIGASHRHIYYKIHNPQHTRLFDQKRWLMAWQLSPLCFEIGRSHLRFNAEFGYGIDGIANFGVSYHF